MIPNNWKELPPQTSPEFLEEIGFRGTVPSGHPVSVLAMAKNALRAQFRAEINFTAFGTYLDGTAFPVRRRGPRAPSGNHQDYRTKAHVRRAGTFQPDFVAGSST
jgi:hypothetical protein